MLFLARETCFFSIIGLIVCPARVCSFTSFLSVHHRIQPSETLWRESYRQNSIQLFSSKLGAQPESNSSFVAPPLPLSQYAFDKPLPNLIPPQDTPGLAKLELEFYDMMREFGEFTPKDISSVKDPRYRSLYEGVSAGSNEPEVMNAFAIVFQDYLPIRVAGRMIYRHLKNTMEKSMEERNTIENKLVDENGLDLETIDNGRRAFLALMEDDNHEGELTIQGLIDSGIVETILELLKYDSFEAFVKTMDADEDGKLSFEKFMVGLQMCAVSDGERCDVSCDLSEVLTEIRKRMEPLEAKKKEIDVSERTKKYSERYDTMVKSFEEWEDVIPNGDGRMIEVLRGCFAGARNGKIVGALKIVYMDYSALRVGGDLVFKLMSKLVNNRKQKTRQS